LCLVLTQAKNQYQGRNNDNPASDAEKSAQNPGSETQSQKKCYFDHIRFLPYSLVLLFYITIQLKKPTRIVLLMRRLPGTIFLKSTGRRYAGHDRT
jgi:hypothetical protein